MGGVVSSRRCSYAMDGAVDGSCVADGRTEGRRKSRVHRAFGLLLPSTNKKKPQSLHSVALISQHSPVKPFPNELMEKIVNKLGGYDGSFVDRIRAAAVCDQVRKAVLDTMRQMKGRFVKIELHNNYIIVNDIRVNNKLRRPNTQMETINAILTCSAPTQLEVTNTDCSRHRRLNDVYAILSSVSPLSVTRLILQLDIGRFEHKPFFGDILRLIGSMSNLQSLFLLGECKKTATSRVHLSSSPLIPADSPFNHVLTLERLQAIDINIPRLVSLSQWGDMLLRLPSAITHLCCCSDIGCNLKMLQLIGADIRANITSVCERISPKCLEVLLLLLAQLPQCQSIWLYCIDTPFPSQPQIDAMGRSLLELCHNDDGHKGNTLEVQIEIVGEDELREYLADGRATSIRYSHGHTSVRVRVGLWPKVNEISCPFNYDRRHHL